MGSHPALFLLPSPFGWAVGVEGRAQPLTGGAELVTQRAHPAQVFAPAGPKEGASYTIPSCILSLCAPKGIPTLPPVQGQELHLILVVPFQVRTFCN